MTIADALIKTFYMNSKVINNVHAKAILYDRTAKKAQTDVAGKNYTYAVRSGRNRYAGRGIAEGGDYGTLGSQASKTVVVPNAEIVTGIELSARLLAAGDQAGKAAFVNVFRHEVEWNMADTIQALNRQLHSDGRDTLGFWTGADDTSGTNIDDGQGNGFPIFLEDGTTICDVVDASDHSTLLGTAIVVTKGAETSSNLAITWTGTVSGSADGDYLVTSGTLGKAMMGIRGIVDDADPPLLAGGLHGLPVASNTFWKSQMFGNSGTNRALTMALMQQPLTQIGLRSSASESDIDLLICNGKFKDKYIELLVADQIHPNVTTLKGGQTAVEFNGKQIVVDPYCQRNSLYYLNTSALDFLTATGGLGWADFDGSKWVKKIGSSGYAAAYQAFITIQGNLCTTNRASHAKLEDITD